MAINTKDFMHKIRVGLSANSDYTKFYYNFKTKFKNTRHRGIIDYSNKAWDKKEKKKNAEIELFKIKDDAEHEIDTDATLNEMVELYLKSLPDNNYKKNRKSYYDRKVKNILGNKKARDILPMHIQEVVDTNMKAGDSPRTARQTIEILSPAFKIARANRIVVFNPCLDVTIKIPKAKKIVVNATDRLSAIYDAIIKLYSDNPYYLSFFLLALQGRRKGEIIKLRWEHISFEYDYYFLDETKNNEEQKIFLPPNVKEALLKFKQKRGWVFVSPINSKEHIVDAKRQIAKLKKELGNWFTMHYTRNVMVSAMAERGIDAIYMSGALGHNDPNTITKYLTMNYLKGSRIASDMIQ